MGELIAQQSRMTRFAWFTFGMALAFGWWGLLLCLFPLSSGFPAMSRLLGGLFFLQGCWLWEVTDNGDLGWSVRYGWLLVSLTLFILHSAGDRLVGG